jgi:hypothetical protein
MSSQKDRDDEIASFVLEFYLRHKYYPTMTELIDIVVKSGHSIDIAYSRIRNARLRGKILFIGDYENEKNIALPEITHPEFGTIPILTTVN